MYMKKYALLSVLLLCFCFVKAQRAYYHQGFEGATNNAPELSVLDIDGGEAWTIYGTTSTNLGDGLGHSSFNTAGINNNGTNDDWMILPRLRVFKDYKISFWAQAWNPATPESFHLVASKDADSSKTSAYTINIADITVNSSGNVDPNWGNAINGAIGQWVLYEFTLDAVSGLADGDVIFVALHYDSPTGVTLLVDELQYDYWCAGQNSWGTTVQEDAYGDGQYTSSIWFNIFTTSFNEIVGPMTTGMAGNTDNDVYADSYAYLADRSYGMGTATIIQGQKHHMGILGIHQSLGNRFPTKISAWLDYNQNGVFDVSEKLSTQSFAGNAYTYGFADLFYFNVPADATLGYTRLRVKIHYDADGTSLPCEDYGYGQIWDYDVNVIPSIGPQPLIFNGGSPANTPSLMTNSGLYITRSQILNAANPPDLDHQSAYFGWDQKIGAVTTTYGYNYSNIMWKEPTNLKASTTYTINLTASQNNCALGAWIDFNNDGIFNEALVSAGGEKLGVFASSNGKASFTFTVPANVKDSQQIVLRTRVILKAQSASLTSTFISSPANLNNETEDYRVRLINPVACKSIVINSSPANVTICPTNSANFSVSFSEGDAPLTYTWQVSTNGTTWNNIAAAGSSPTYSNWTGTAAIPSTKTLGLTNVVVGNNGYKYRCIATDPTGKCNATSNAATLTVTNSITITSITPALVKCEGEIADFQVIATGDALSYQWMKNSSNINGATKSNLQFNPVMPANAGNYSCNISNSCNSISANTSLTVNSKVVFIDTIPNLTKCQGENVTFSFNAPGTNLSYQWTKGAGNITGATNSTYTISNIKPVDYDEYSCKVSNNCGPKALPKFILTVNTPPVSNIKYTKQSKLSGDAVSYSLSPGGTGPFSFQWKKDGADLTGQTNSVFSINSISCGDKGLYTCQITNACSVITPKVVELFVSCDRYKFVISGFVKYENNDSFRMTSSTTNTVTNISLLTTDNTLIEKTETDDNGFYVFADIVNGDYKITGSTSKLWGGSNPADALLVNRDYIGVKKIIGPPSLKRLAADVNGDGKRTPTDALLINRRYIGAINHFGISDWLFSKPDITVETGDITVNLFALCAGDVNGSYSNIPPKNMYTSVKNSGLLNINSGKEFDLPVYINDINEIGALGIKLKNEDSNLKIIGLNSEEKGIIYNITEDGINIAWAADNQGLNITPDKPVFVLRAVYKGLQNPADLQLSSESIIIDNNINAISNEYLVMPKLVIGNSSSSGFSLFNHPNPFSYITNIEYTIPEDATVKLIVYNVLGEKISTLKDERQKAGKYTLQFDGSGLKQGVYYCKIEAANSSSVYSNTNILIIAR